MLFPRTAVASATKFPTGAFGGAAVAEGSGLGDADDDEPAAGGVAAEAAGIPPRLLTKETRASISAAFSVKGTMPAVFIWAVGAFKIAVN
jgi:hypothetical protein